MAIKRKMPWTVTVLFASLCIIRDKDSSINWADVPKEMNSWCPDIVNDIYNNRNINGSRANDRSTGGCVNWTPIKYVNDLMGNTGRNACEKGKGKQVGEYSIECWPSKGRVWSKPKAMTWSISPQDAIAVIEILKSHATILEFFKGYESELEKIVMFINGLTPLNSYTEEELVIHERAERINAAINYKNVCINNNREYIEELEDKLTNTIVSRDELLEEIKKNKNNEEKLKGELNDLTSKRDQTINACLDMYTPNQQAGIKNSFSVFRKVQELFKEIRVPLHLDHHISVAAVRESGNKELLSILHTPQNWLLTTSLANLSKGKKTSEKPRPEWEEQKETLIDLMYANMNPLSDIWDEARLGDLQDKIFCAINNLEKVYNYSIH